MKNTPLYLSARLRQTEAAALQAGLPLMQRAGAASAAWILKHYPKAQTLFVLAGPGNNGGDALVTATLLRQAGKNVLLRLTGYGSQPEAREALAGWMAQGGQITDQTPAFADLAIDGLFGIGLNRAPSAADSQIIAEMQDLACPVVSLDIPSGLMADTGSAPGAVVIAANTLSFISHKPGLFTGQGCNASGSVSLHDLAIPKAFYPEPDGFLQIKAPAALVQLLRRPDSHKGSYGTAGIIGGAAGMTGAALLAGRAAINMGAGRVVLGLIEPTLTVDPLQPELMLYSAAEALSHPALTMQVIGPGLGSSPRAFELLQQGIASPLPLLLDADALNLLASSASLAQAVRQRTAATILTPHPAEAARLLQTTSKMVQASRIQTAQTLAQQYNATVLLKGAGSVCCDQGSWSINASGNAALSGAGQGDVLSGIIAALVAQGLSPFAAVQASCWLHGKAADNWRKKYPNGIGLTAGETIAYAREALNQALAG